MGAEDMPVDVTPLERLISTDGTTWALNCRGEEESDALRSPRSPSWWTGLKPAACPGWRNASLHSLPLPVRPATPRGLLLPRTHSPAAFCAQPGSLQDVSVCDRQACLDYFDNSWTITEVLFSSLLGASC
jgi:hypothetical protein